MSNQGSHSAHAPPITSFTLDQTGSALDEIAGGHVRGKLVIAVR